MEATMTRRNWGRAFTGGIVAGVVAGLVLAAILVGMNVVEGRDIWPALKGAGMPFLGERAAQPGFDLQAVLIGAGSHFGISIIWGLLFAVLFYGASKLGTVSLGAAWGIVVWLVMYYVVLPLAGLSELPKMVPLSQAVLTHLVFGLIIGIAFLPFQRPRRQREPALADRLGTST
jgi:uncharacterized membrane protein YagU involved in acid resistance